MIIIDSFINVYIIIAIITKLYCKFGRSHQS